jgi:hypothetical protein
MEVKQVSTTFKCSVCKQTVAQGHSDFTTGYGVKPGNGHKVCYACCAARDKADMLKTGRATLYLTIERPELYKQGYRSGKVSNWPGSLEIPVFYRRGRHNITGCRFDVWFTFKGQNWHGVQYGENTQICHCRRIA